MPAELSFIGLETSYPVAQGGTRQRIHLDGAASPLASSIALETILSILPHYKNTHSYVHTSAQILTHALAWAHEQILDVFNADKTIYTAVFNGSGCTANINRVARGLTQARPEQKIVLVSAMEHHANDLPHRQNNNQVIYMSLVGEGKTQGIIDLNELERLLKEHAGNVNYIAFSAVSNVTGVTNPVSEITQLAHQYGSLVLVDAAQSVAHQANDLSDSAADFVVFSGHKVFTPTAPGVLIAKKELLDIMPGQDLGGGSVEDVSYHDFLMLSDYPDKEQSGTPNIIGAIALAKVLASLQQFGYDKIESHDQALITQLLKGLSELPNITVYADPASPRVGALAFNHKEIDHGLLAAILNDYFCIAVRNECFCAHPYVSSMLKEELWELDLASIPEHQQQAFINRKRGMVRASVSLYNNKKDIETLLQALIEIDEKRNDYKELYKPLDDGSYKHLSFDMNWQDKWQEFLPNPSSLDAS